MSLTLDQITALHPINEGLWLSADLSTPEVIDRSCSWFSHLIVSAELVAEAARTLNVANRKPNLTLLQVTEISNRINDFKDELKERWIEPQEQPSPLFPYAVFVLPTLYTFWAAILLHFPRAHFANANCPHWTRCLKVAKDAIPHFLRLFTEPIVLHPLASLTVFLITRILIYESHYNGDSFGFVESMIDTVMSNFRKITKLPSAATAKKYVNHLSELQKNLAGDFQTRDPTSPCPCSEFFVSGECSPESVIGVIAAIKMYDKEDQLDASQGTEICRDIENGVGSSC